MATPRADFEWLMQAIEEAHATAFRRRFLEPNEMDVMADLEQPLDSIECSGLEAEAMWQL